MSTEANATKGSCLLVFRNKKINNFDFAEKMIDEIASNGYWLDKISYIAFDNSAEIVNSVKEAKKLYSVLIIVCPQEMERALKEFIEPLFGAEFDNFGILNCNNSNVFMLFSDTKNRINTQDICKTLDKRRNEKYGRAYIKTVGAPVAAVNSAIAKAKAFCGDINFNITDSYGDCCIEFVFSENIQKSMFDSAYRAVLYELNDYVYAIENVSLSQRLVELLKLRRMKICTAESFTGGGVGKRIVEISGASEVYFEGLNTYSNEAKINRLGISEQTLKAFGAVSEQTACEMAEGLLKQGNCDIAVSTTGIAGPKSDNTKKPVGLLYIAVGTENRIMAYKYNLKGSRENITKTAINLALFLAYKAIK